MSQRIRQLSEQVANQIAAGEVVERPASVVKELLDNALDAGARRVRVEVEGGGAELVRVIDDGLGMSREDAPLSLDRHATSKLWTAEDLQTVATLGFRGEALPSIASVSRFSLTTRPAGQDTATRVRVEGGGPRSVEEVGAPVGTTMEVRDLFFNVPARRKFLKRASTELGHISETVTRAALVRPELSISLRSSGRMIIDVPADAGGDPRGRLSRVLGAKLAEALYPIPGQAPGPVTVRGFVSAPGESQRTSRGLYVFVNGRFVRDRTIQHAIQDGYRSLLEKGRYPSVLLSIQLDPSLVDVNVHPQKTEVRFTDTQLVHRAVSAALSTALSAQPWLPAELPGRVAPPSGAGLGGARYVGQTVGAGSPWRRSWSGEPKDPALAGASVAREPPAAEDPRARAEAGLAEAEARWRAEARRAADLDAQSGLQGRGSASIGAPTEWGAEPGPEERGLGAQRAEEQGAERALSEEGAPPAPELGLARPGPFAQLKPVGQLLGTYLVCEGPEGMVLIDQHAAHERVVYARLRAQAAEARVQVQPLLMPLRVELDPRRGATAEAEAEVLAALGLELEPFGGQTWLIKSTPALLGPSGPEQLLFDLLDRLAEGGTSGAEDKLDALCARAACHAAVRAQDKLTNEEVKALLTSMDETALSAHCPHGRPVFVRWSAAELARLFHRS